VLQQLGVLIHVTIPSALISSLHFRLRCMDCHLGNFPVCAAL
jgi:hypothetical protein